MKKDQGRRHHCEVIKRQGWRRGYSDLPKVRLIRQMYRVRKPSRRRDKAARLASRIIGHQLNNEIVAFGSYILRDIDLTSFEVGLCVPTDKGKVDICCSCKIG